MRRTAGLLVVAVLALSACGGTDDTLEQNPDPTVGPAISEEEAVRIASEVTEGEVDSVAVTVKNGDIVYRVVFRQPGSELLVGTSVLANTGEVLVSEALVDGHVPSDGGPVVNP